MQFHPQYSETVAKLEEALNSPRLMVFGRVNVWLEQGATPEEIIDVCTRIAKTGRWSGSNLGYFDGAISQSIADRTKPLPAAQPRPDRTGAKREPIYAPLAQLSGDDKDAYDRRRADMLNKGMNVMSVTYQDAARMFKRGWLTPATAERLGVA